MRIGWIVSHASALLHRILEFKDYTTICSAAPSEILALIALRASKHIAQRNLEVIHANIDAFSAFVAGRPHLFEWAPPRAGSVAFARLKTGEDVEAFCHRLVKGCGVLLLPASVYDHVPSAEAGYFRIGLGRRNFPDCLAVFAAFVDEHCAAGSKGGQSCN